MQKESMFVCRLLDDHTTGRWKKAENFMDDLDVYGYFYLKKEEYVCIRLVDY
jgi:hypothetical protein